MNNILSLLGKEDFISLKDGSTLSTIDLLSFESLKEIRYFLGKNAGIYCWFNCLNCKVYIGSSKNIWKRFLTYKNAFFYRKTQRVNVKLRNSVEKYGVNNFKFFVLEIFNGDDYQLRSLEENYLDKYKPFNKNGYNIRKETVPSYKPVQLTKDMIQKIKDANTGENSSNAILNNESVLNIKKDLINGIKLKILSKKYNVSTTVISNIKRGLTWSHIKLSATEEEKLAELKKRDSRKNLSPEIVINIKREILEGKKMKDIAKKYNISYTGVAGLKYGHFYKNINP